MFPKNSPSFLDVSQLGCRVSPFPLSVLVRSLKRGHPLTVPVLKYPTVLTAHIHMISLALYTLHFYCSVLGTNCHVAISIEIRFISVLFCIVVFPFYLTNSRSNPFVYLFNAIFWLSCQIALLCTYRPPRTFTRHLRFGLSQAAVVYPAFFVPTKCSHCLALCSKT